MSVLQVPVLSLQPETVTKFYLTNITLYPFDDYAIVLTSMLLKQLSYRTLPGCIL